MPRKGKGSKWNRQPAANTTKRRQTASRTAIDLKDVRKVMERLGLSFEKAAEHVRLFGASLEELEKATRKQREIKRNESFVTSREIRSGELVVIDENGKARVARRGEAPIGMVIGNSHQSSGGKSTFSVTVRPDNMLR